MGVAGQRHDPAPLPPERTGTHLQEAGWAPGPVWAGAENLASTGIRSPDRPARSESLYRLSYPGPGKRNSYVYIHRVLDVLPCWKQQVTQFVKLLKRES
jgi:hypothetical protein